MLSKIDAIDRLLIKTSLVTFCRPSPIDFGIAPRCGAAIYRRLAGGEDANFRFNRHERKLDFFRIVMPSRNTWELD